MKALNISYKALIFTLTWGLILALGTVPVFSQSCFEAFMAEAETAFEQQDYPVARDLYECALNCPEIQSDPAKRKIATERMNSAAEKVVDVLTLRKRRAQIQAYLKTEEALGDPTKTLCLLNHYVQSDFGAQDLYIKDDLYNWYQEHSFYARTLSPVSEQETLRDMAWQGNTLATSTVEVRGESTDQFTSHLYAWDPLSGVLNTKTQINDSIIRVIRFDQTAEDNSQILFSGYDANNQEIFLGLWDWRSNETFYVEEFHQKLLANDNTVVTCMEWLDEGKLIIGDNEGWAYIFDYRLEKLDAYLKVSEGEIWSLDVREVNHEIVCIIGAQNGEAKILEIDTRRSEIQNGNLPTFGDKHAPHEGNELNAHAHVTAFLPYEDDIRVVCGGCSDRLAIYAYPQNAEDKRLLSVCGIMRGDISALHINDDGEILVGDEQGNILMLDKKGNRTLKLEGHHDQIVALAPSPDGEWMASADKSGLVLVWNIAFNQKGNLIGTIPIDGGATHTMEMRLPGPIAFTGHKLHNFGTANYGTDALTVREHIGNDSLLALDPKGQFFLVSNYDSVFLYDLNSNLSQKYGGIEDSITVLEWTHDRRYIIAGSRNHSLVVWETFQPQSIRKLTGHESSISAIAYASDGRALVSASVDGEIMVWNEDMIYQYSLPSFQGLPRSLTFGNGHKELFVGFQDGLIIHYRLFDNQAIQEDHFIGHQGAITGLQYDSTLQQLISTAEDNRVIGWDRDGNKTFNYATDAPLLSAVVSTLGDEQILFFMAEDQIHLFRTVPNLDEMLNSGSVQIIEEKDIWMEYVRAGTEIDLGTLVMTLDTTTILKMADLYYDKAKSSQFLDEIPIVNAYQLYSTIPLDRMDLSHINNLIICREKLKIPTPELLGKEALVYGTYLIQKGLQEIQPIRSDSLLRAGIQNVLISEQRQVKYHERGQYLLQAIFQLEDTSISIPELINQDSRGDILAFVTHITELITSNKKSSAIHSFWLQKGLEAIGMIPSFMKSSTVIGHQSELYILLREFENLTNLGEFARKGESESEFCLNIIEYVVRRGDELPATDTLLQIDYLLGACVIIEEVTLIPAELIEGIYISLADLYLGLNDPINANIQLKKARRYDVQTNVNDPRIPILEAFATLLSTEDPGEINRAINVLNQAANANKIVEEEHMADFIFNRLNTYDEGKMFSDELLTKVDRLREYILFNQPLARVLESTRVSHERVRQGIEYFQYQVEAQSAYSKKIEYQQHLVELLRIASPRRMGQELDSLIRVETGKLTYLLALSGEYENALRLASAIESDNLQEYYQWYYLRGMVLVFIASQSQEEWKSLIRRYFHEQHENQILGITFWSDLQIWEDLGVPVEELPDAIEYCQSLSDNRSGSINGRRRGSNSLKGN